MILLLTACGAEQKVSTYTAASDPEKQQEIQKMLEGAKEIESANIIILNDEVLVAMQVKPWKGWVKEKIEKKWQKKIEKAYPNLQVDVSTDFKLHWESLKLLEEQDSQKVAKKMKKLKKLAKEEA